MGNLPQPIRKIGRIVLDYKDWILSRYWLNMVQKNPEKHAMYEMKRQKQDLIRPVNLREPVYFHEKTLWLTYFIYNNSSLIAQCYNKYEVRDYIISRMASGLLHCI